MTFASPGTAKIKAGDQLQEVSVDLIAGCDGVNSAAWLSGISSDFLFFFC